MGYLARVTHRLLTEDTMMAHAEGALSREDRFTRRSNQRLLASAAAFALWQVADMLREAAGDAARVPLLVVSLAAASAWTVLLLFIVRDARLAKRDPVLRAALQDERARDVRLRAYRVGFWSAVVGAAVLGIPAAAHALPAYAAMRLVVVAGITAFLGAYVFFDRE
jgi:hypothetical protein